MRDILILKALKEYSVSNPNLSARLLRGGLDTVAYERGFPKERVETVIENLVAERWEIQLARQRKNELEREQLKKANEGKDT